MRNIIMTGAAVRGFRLNNDGTKGIIKVVVNIYENKEQKSIWATCFIDGKLLERWQKLNPADGTGINLYGDFNVSLKQTGNGTPIADLVINVKNFELAKAYGSGLCEVTISGCRIIKEPVETEHAIFAVGAYDSGKGCSYIRLSCFGSAQQQAKNMKIKKGSTVDITVKYSHEIFEKEGQYYLNINGVVVNMNYTALPKKATNEPSPSDTPAPPDEPPMPPMPNPDTAIPDQVPLSDDDMGFDNPYI